MRSRVIGVLVLLVVLVVLGAQISELFDSWDNTLQTGNDIEFNLTLVALCLGTCLLLVRCLFPLVSSSDSQIYPSLLQYSLATRPGSHDFGSVLLPVSPPPLRV